MTKSILMCDTENTAVVLFPKLFFFLAAIISSRSLVYQFACRQRAFWLFLFPLVLSLFRSFFFFTLFSFSEYTVYFIISPSDACECIGYVNINCEHSIICCQTSVKITLCIMFPLKSIGRHSWCMFFAYFAINVWIFEWNVLFNEQF